MATLTGSIRRNQKHVVLAREDSNFNHSELLYNELPYYSFPSDLDANKAELVVIPTPVTTMPSTPIRD
ncbi:hypothetical protein LSH36_878g01006 [Paralvinella palmiformis]|uniref:Uncharacterized protein n=1 Tax=Paralvinella palmiformis TaxID=53620 RepID=A0AAD9IZ94_9ANNE|nr:hypothetical protein LSH36_878g01006 [Paralvinella palmiformis]